MLAHAKDKSKGNVEIQVVSSKTSTYTEFSRGTPLTSKTVKDAYAYTDHFFAIVNGKHLVYSCAERKKVCPMLESGSKITVEQDGDSIYIPVAGTSEQKPSYTHYKLVGESW